MALMRGHRGSQREVLGCGTGIAGAGQREAEPELGVVVSRAGLYDQPEVAGRGGVLTCVELRPGEGL